MLAAATTLAEVLKPAAIAAAVAGAEARVERAEPMFFMFTGCFMFTAGFFVPPTATRGAGRAIGLVGSGLLFIGAYQRYALARPVPAASGVDLASDAES